MSFPGLPQAERYYNEFYRYFWMLENCHPQDEIMYVAQGTCRTPCYDEENQTWQEIVLNEGNYIYIRGGTVHNLFVERGSPCRILNLEYRPGSDNPSWRERTPWTVNRDDGSLLRILQIVHDKMRARENGCDSDQGRAEEDIGLSVLLLERKIIQQQDNPPAFHDHAGLYVFTAQDYIRDHYAENFFVADIARHVGVASAYLQRLFRQKTGGTITEYVNSLRLQRSKYLLTHSELSIADVAENAGYGSRQRFSQIFRAMEHCSPGEYRAAAHKLSEN